jgi:hypothetical protein
MTKTKTIYLLIKSKSMLPVHGGIEVGLTTAFKVVGEWDGECKEYYFAHCRAYYHVGNFEMKKIPPHCFESGEMRYPWFIPQIGDVSQDEILELFQAELNAATPTNPEKSEYAETVFKFWRGELKYNTVTVMEAV